MTFCYTLDTIEKISKDLVKNFTYNIIVFNGEMGAGKTTLIKSICKTLGATDTVSSPTFSLVNEYKTTKETIFHFDCYRLKNHKEALDFGIEEYLYSQNWCFIEWADKIESLLPEKYHTISITTLDNQTRKLDFK